MDLPVCLKSRTMERYVFFLSVQPPDGYSSWTGPGQTQAPRAPSESLTCVAGALAIVPSSAAFPGTLQEGGSGAQ